MISMKDLDNFEGQVSIWVLQGLKMREEGDTGRAPGHKKLHHHILILAHKPGPGFAQNKQHLCWRESLGMLTSQTVGKWWLCQQ